MRFTDDEFRDSPLFECVKNIIKNDKSIPNVLTRSKMLQLVEELRVATTITFKFVDDNVEGDVEYVEVDDDYYSLILLKYL